MLDSLKYDWILHRDNVLLFQFERLWSSLKVNDFGNLDYHDFIKKYTTDPTPPKMPPPTPLQRSTTSVFGKRPESMALRRSTTRVGISINIQAKLHFTYFEKGDNQHNLSITLLLRSKAETVLLKLLCYFQSKVYRVYRKMTISGHFSI